MQKSILAKKRRGGSTIKPVRERSKAEWISKRCNEEP